MWTGLISRRCGDLFFRAPICSAKALDFTRLPFKRSFCRPALPLTSVSSPTPMADPSQYRLPTDLKPTHYDVTIKTDLKAQTFEGVVKVNLDVVKDTNKVVFNSTDLDLGESSISSNNSVEKNKDYSYDKTQERISFTLPNALTAGSQALLTVPFKGVLTTSMMGYYKSSYDNNGQTEYYALTQFEPTAARRAFPCWDEPLLKATFAVTLITRENTVALSNMNALSEKVYEHGSPAEDKDITHILSELPKDDKWKITKFDTTPKMSSYIVAFANGPFKHIERTVKLPLSGKEIPIRVYATEDLIHQGDFALDVKARVLPLYEQVFDVGFPLPKLDTLVANDFDAGAMENWGLITGRQNAFCIDPKSKDLKAKKWVSEVQSHEVAHMWFGNITTMEWWTYLYLNEGFATLMGEVIIQDKIFPEWKVYSEFISVHLNKALLLDAKPSSHPVEVICDDANQINQIFDTLSYSKAASVLYMLSAYVGEEKFLKGVSLYLKEKLYANSVTNDLWEGISKATGIDITNFMTNWISKIGFPIVTVKEDSNGVTVRQDRFLETGEVQDKDNKTLWNVPLNIVSVDGSGKASLDRKPVLGVREKSFHVDTSKAFKLNAGQSGFYRVHYTPERLSKIATEAVKEDSIFTLEDRLGLVQDAVALSKAGFSKLSSTLTLINIFRNEKEYLVWAGMADSLDALANTWWEHPEILDKLNTFRRSLFVPLVKRLGYDFPADEHPDITQLRALAVTAAAKAGDESVNSELRSRFQHLMKTGDDSKIAGDLQAITYSQSIKYGGRPEFDAVLGIIAKPKTPSSRVSAMRALGHTEDPELLKETFDYILNKTRDQDVFYPMAGVEASVKNRRQLPSFLESNYDNIYKRFEGNFSLKMIIEITYRSLTTEADVNHMVEFFKGKDISKFSMSYEQVLDSIKGRSTFIKRSTNDLSQWLKDWGSGKL